ncbi:hypothetical protein HDU76_012766 [Blyttiomyces sp. JEL0837]|nr:hypothetical protein HDU76_012766 [Blyttiomyces sp. JEL0837]
MILARSIKSPLLGNVPLVYCDFVASGRPLRAIENAILTHVLPYYANTHTDTATTGRLMTDLREEARRVIKKCCGASNADYSLIFTGSGTTAAVNKLVGILRITQLANEANNAPTLELANQLRPLLIVSLAEHHSNLLPWRDSGVDVEMVPFADQGLIDLGQLETILKTNSHRKTIIGSFTAASNVLALQQPVEEIAKLMHLYNGIVIFDYACGGPYMDIDIVRNGLDAIVLSPHKFLGGTCSPGVLIFKNSIYGHGLPIVAGGGAVRWVDSETHLYLTSIEGREEAGTPDIVGSIRAGLSFYIKSLVTTNYIRDRQQRLTELTLAKLNSIPNIHVLGCKDPSDPAKLPIFSFQLKCPNVPGKYIHHHFFATILNDVFGIQTRSGCSCAATLLFHAVKADKKQVAFLKDSYLSTKLEGLKPGFVRFNLSYTHNETEIEYILNAIRWTASRCHLFLPMYSHDPKSGAYHAAFVDHLTPVESTIIANKAQESKPLSNLKPIPTFFKEMKIRLDRVLKNHCLPVDGIGSGDFLDFEGQARKAERILEKFYDDLSCGRIQEVMDPYATKDPEWIRNHVWYVQPKDIINFTNCKYIEPSKSLFETHLKPSGFHSNIRFA